MENGLAREGAARILGGFDAYQERFKSITRRARQRFEAHDRDGMRHDTDERLDLYRLVLDDTEADVRSLLGERVEERALWKAMKARYAERVAGRPDWELAETFFNSATRRVFDTVGVDAEIEFVAAEFELPGEARPAVYRIYAGSLSTESLVEEILGDVPFSLPYQNLERDVRLVAEEVRAHLKTLGAAGTIEKVEFASEVFYRGMGAYLIGRMWSTERHLLPLSLALVNTEDGLVVDAALLNEDEVSILFSFARAYFHVETDCPRDLVSFLKRILPRKRLAELYISIGYNRHGKTELYRDLLDHLMQAKGVFRRAEGQRGMVMSVFTMESYDIVFKLIKDRFDYPKSITRQQVKEQYGLVYKHDRAGRLVDAQEFEELQLGRAHFAEELLEELEEIAARSITAAEDEVTIHHTYVQRRVTPLNVYVREEAPEKAHAAIIDYGNAIKDLAVTNIFTGDLLLKNFGVTRHGRVVFYDYDELSLVTECTFREKPEPKTHMQEMASEPWYYVGPDDIFPEEFRTALGLRGELLEVFESEHADLFEARFWQGIQERLKSGEEIPIYPYPPRRRLPRLWDAEAEVVPAGVANG